MDGRREFEPLRDHALKIAAACATIGLLWVLTTDFISAALRQGGPWSQVLIDSMSIIYLLTTTLVVCGMVWSYLHHLGKIGGRDGRTAGFDAESANSLSETVLRRHALGIAVAYTVLGYAWLLLPDAVIAATGLGGWIDVTGRSRLAIFILLATCLIYLWARAHAARVGRAQRTLAGRLGDLGRVVDLLPQQIFVKDTDGRYLLRNEAFLRGRGTGVEQSGDDTPQAVEPSPADGVPLLLEERLLLAAAAGALTTDEVTVDGRGRRRVLQTTRVPLTGSRVGSPAILGLSIDVTDSRRTEEALRYASRKNAPRSRCNRSPMPSSPPDRAAPSTISIRPQRSSPDGLSTKPVAEPCLMSSTSSTGKPAGRCRICSSTPSRSVSPIATATVSFSSTVAVKSTPSRCRPPRFAKLTTLSAAPLSYSETSPIRGAWRDA